MAGEQHERSNETLGERRTGSHPVPAVKPLVPHPGFLPDVISLNPGTPVEYMIGFRKPSEDFPLAMRKSLRSEMTPAKVFMGGGECSMAGIFIIAIKSPYRRTSTCAPNRLYSATDHHLESLSLSCNIRIGPSRGAKGM